MIAAFALTTACSSPREKHEERQEEARERYHNDMESSQEKYYDEDLEVQKEEAKEMIDDSDSIDVNKDDGRIRVDD